ncbi:MAG: DegT/DnrJ/EryC1/StrS family aminotransferase [Planctomycetes bacterium]|nr:DegT/DnrJ/EryC1/StrS family aminotransferase [Planctomycetota bacterium]
MTSPGGLSVPFGTVTITERARSLIQDALARGQVSGGRLVAEFEARFAALHGVREAVAVSSGTDADTLALAVLHDFGARRGDEVIVPALSFVATGSAVLHAGFTPVFVDVDLRTLNIDAGAIEAAVTERTRAIMPVHLMGKPADMDAVLAVARRHKLAVIEDAAEAHGALWRGRRVGTIGDMGAFSTYVAHIITTIEGGVVITDREEYAEVLRSLRAHGRSCTCKRCVMSTGGGYCERRFGRPGVEDTRFVFDRIGYSSKMNELEAAVGLGHLDLYETILAKRYRNLKYALERFGALGPHLYTIGEEPHERLGPHALPVIIGKDASLRRRDLIEFLQRRRIDSRTLFASMPTQCPGFAFLGYRPGQFPNAEYLGTHGLHVGVHQDLELEHMEYVLDSLRGFLERAQR